MSEDFFPRISPDPSMASPDRSTQGEVLERQRFADLYERAERRGLPYFSRLNHLGEVELFLVFESVDAFQEQTSDAVSLEFKTYRQKLLAIIWTLSDPQHPLGFPLSFAIDQAEDRFLALQMLEQRQTMLHYLAYEQGMLTHIYTEPIHLSAGETERVRQMIRSLYESENTSLPAGAEVQEADVQTLPAICLPAQVLREEGFAYVFAYDRILAEHGEEAGHHLLMSMLQQAVLVMRRHARSEVRESSFTVWVAEQSSRLCLIVTPTLHNLFKAIHPSDAQANPFFRVFAASPAFVQREEANPLALGAYPILRCEAGQLYHLEIDAQTGEMLARFFREQDAQGKNPYEALS